MSDENVEIARTLFETFNRTFAEGTADFYDLVDPAVEWVPMSALLEGTPYFGHDGVRQWVEDMRRDWATLEAGPEEFRAVGDDRVLVLGTWHAEAREGGAPLDFPQASWLLRIQRGKLVLARAFPERAQAFEAAGLED